MTNNGANFYFQAGRKETYIEYAREVGKEAMNDLETNGFRPSRDYNPYLILKQIYDNLGEYNKFLELLKRLKAGVPTDPTIDRLIDQYQKLSSESVPKIPQQNK